MTRNEHLLTLVAEECAEVAQRASKALRFGLEEVQEGQELTNAQRLFGEFLDLCAIIDILSDAQVIDLMNEGNDKLITAKKERVEKWLDYSKTQGTLSV